jgi:MFS family permease
MRPEAPEAEEAGVLALVLPLAVVMIPQAALAAVQHGLAALGPEITAAVGLPPEAVGVISGLVGAGSVWFFAASGAVIGPLGPVRALIAACALSTAAATVMLSGSAVLLLLAAPLVGFAYAATAPAGSEILSVATPRQRWSALFSIRMAGVPAGGAAAAVVATGLASAYSWRAGLGALALAPMLCAAFLLVAARRWRGGPRGAVRLGAVLSPRNIATPFATLRRAPGLARLTVASAGFATVQGGGFAFLTTYLVHGVGLTLPLAGALFATMQGASFVGRIGMGVVAARMGSARRVLIRLGLASAAGAALLTLAHPAVPTPLLFLGAAAAGVAIATWNGLLMACIAEAAPKGEVAAATSAATFFTFLAYMATPLAFAAISVALGYRAAYLLSALAALGAAAVIATGADPARRS